MRVNTLSFRLFLAAAGWGLVLLLVAALLLSNLYRRSIEDNFDERLELYLKTLVAGADWNEDGGIVAMGDVGEPRFETLYSGWYWQIKDMGEQGPPVFASKSLWIDRLPLPSEEGLPANAEGIRETDVEGPQGEPLRLIERRITYEDTGRAYSFAVAADTREVAETVAAFRSRVIWALGILGAAMAAITLFQVRYGLRPLKSVSRQLGAIRSGQQKRLDGEFPAEIDQLAQELNALVESNEAIVERARTHVGNLAHALKTPLSVLTNEAAGTRSPFGRKVIEQAAIMQEQVTRHLDRARVAARANVIGAVTPVEAPLRALVRAMEKIHDERNLAISLHCEGDVKFAGERQDFDEIAGNLVDNACKWANGKVTITATRIDAAMPPLLRLTVDDDGPGLSKKERTEVLRRGARLDETTPGSGLGLSIVAEMVDLYRGKLALKSVPKGGLRAEVELPAVADSV